MFKIIESMNTLKRIVKKIFSSVPKSVWVAVGIALFINTCGLLFIFTHQSPEELIVGDGIGYLELSKNLAGGIGFGQFTQDGFVLETFRMPGLPFLFSLFLKVGLELKAYFIFISFLSSIVIPICSWYIGKKLFTNSVGVLTAFLVSLEPILWLHNWMFFTEIPFLIVVLPACVLLIKAFEKNSIFSYSVLFSGVLFASSIYIRPAAFPLLILALLILCIERLVVTKKIPASAIAIFILVLMCLAPWYVRTHEVTGVYALSGTGWRNVYTDYLASIRALNNDTEFIDEKEALKQYAMKTWDLTRFEINSPENTELLKSYALPEILNNKETVVKLQSVLFVTYFTNSDYQRRLQKLGMLPMNKVENGRVSSTRLVLKEGFGAIPLIYKEMENRYFLPILERVWTFSLLIFAFIGLFVSRSRARYLIFVLLAFGYITSSVIGLGLEGRLRLSILPFYFMLTSCGILWVLHHCKKVIILWKK